MRVVQATRFGGPEVLAKLRLKPTRPGRSAHITHTVLLSRTVKGIRY